MMIDPFAADGFSLTELTAAINGVPFTPQAINASGLFEEDGIMSLDAAIEEQNGVVRLVSVQPRGAPGEPTSRNKRKLRTFRVPHLPQAGAIYADEVLGVRQFGSDSNVELIESARLAKLAVLRGNIDYTMEAHRVAAVLGNYYDVNGDLTSLFTAFGVTQQTVAMAFNASATSGQRAKSMAVLRAIKSALGGLPYTGVRVYCGDNFWDALLEDYDAKATYLNTAMARDLRNDPRLSFTWNGFTWEWYSGSSEVLIPTDEARAVPLGVPGLFITRFGPADYVETVGTKGLPYYAKAEIMKFGKGWDIEAQSNPINLCTRPAAVIKLTKGS